MINGVINVFKEKGYTSHDVVAILRKVLNQKKIGHTGTLDPNAEGVLPVCLGKATKISSLITDYGKEYVAKIQFGSTTDTQDAWGKTIQKYDYIFDEEKIKEVIYSFKGQIEQVPPMYSAIKINGKKLYQLAREGKVINRPIRKIIIDDIEILKITEPDQVEIKVSCSKGTYIRTLCEDIGTKLGYGAHMSSLLRTKSGPFNYKDSHKIAEISEAIKGGNSGLIIPLERLFLQYKIINTKPKFDHLLLNGNKLGLNAFIQGNHLVDGKYFRCYTSDNKFVGIYKIVKDTEDELLKPYKIFI